MNDPTVVKEYRKEKLRAAISAIEIAIIAMEDLINDYDRENTHFSGGIPDRAMQVRCGRCSKLTRH